MKYQFCIRFTGIDVNSAATKAVADCNAILSKNGYKDYTLSVTNNKNKRQYYLKLVRDLVIFFFAINADAIIVIQYPLLSINSIFKYFIKLAKLKRAKIYCIIHDLESLRTGGNDSAAITQEIYNLNNFDCIIAHNDKMIEWLETNGLKKKSISLELFDYLVTDSDLHAAAFNNEICFAGNLSKSTFIYSLDQIHGWTFNVFGPNFQSDSATKISDIKWLGEFSPELVVKKLKGSFGLIWDGKNINKIDDLLGHYLKFNNPHKFSLYIAAGLPVIAPQDAAIGAFIKKYNIGVLVNSLDDLAAVKIDEKEYEEMRRNLIAIRNDVLTGKYFDRAISKAETYLLPHIK